MSHILRYTVNSCCLFFFRWLSPWTSNHILDDIHLPSIFEKNKAVYDVMMIMETKNKQQTVERLNQTITVIPDDERPKEMPPSLAYHVTENLYKSVQYLYNMLSLHTTVQIQGTFVHFRFYHSFEFFSVEILKVFFDKSISRPTKNKGRFQN